MVILPASVKEIGLGVYSSSSLKKVIFKKGSELETIGESVSVHLLLFPNEPRLPQYACHNMNLIAYHKYIRRPSLEVRISKPSIFRWE